MSIRIFDSSDQLRNSPPGPDEVFVYRDEPESIHAGLQWCVAQTRRDPQSGNTKVRDLGAFYARQNALLFAVAFQNPAILNEAATSTP